MVAALAVQSSNTQREIARSQRDNALQAQAHAQAAEIQDMRTKANMQRAQGIVDGTLQIGQGVCDLASGINDAKALTQTDKTAAAASKVTAAWDRAGATALGAGRSIVDGLFNGAITDKDADAKVQDAAAQTFKQIADDAHDSERDAQATIDKAVDFYKEYVDTKAQAAMAAVHRA
jgi:hypothetical protein